jgi:hypothetical protein
MFPFLVRLSLGGESSRASAPDKHLKTSCIKLEKLVCAKWHYSFIASEGTT